MKKVLVAVVVIFVFLLTCSACGKKESGDTKNTPTSNLDEEEKTDTPIQVPVAGTEGLEYILNDSGKSYSCIGIGTATGSNIVIGNTYNGMPVTSIFEFAFAGCDSLTSIVIPNGITSIGNNAFNGCSSLMSIEIPDSITSISYNAFVNCATLTNVVFGENSQLKYIGGSVFVGCSSFEYNTYDNAYYLGNETNPYVVLIEAKDQSITSCQINASTKIIANSAFRSCNGLKNIVIPKTVTRICEYAFYNCSNLTSIVFEENSRLNSMEYSAFKGCSGLANIIIPDGVKRIGDWVFEDCYNLTSVVIPNSVTSIGDYAFENCSSLVYNEYDNAYYLGNKSNPYMALIKAKDASITSCEINANTKYIISTAFKDCSSLTSIEIPVGITSISYAAFSGCSSLTSIIISDSVKSIGILAFEGCSSLTSIEIPDSVTSIGSNAFYGCSSLTSIVIPDSVTSIGNSAFASCSSLASVKIPDSVTSIGISAFAGCSSLASVKIPDSVTIIGYSAFEGCSSLTSVEIPDSVTSIGYQMFCDCNSLASIEIPNSVTNIGEDAFKYCYKLAEVINKSAFDIVSGSEDYGCVAYYAKEVHRGESKIVYYNDYLFYTYNGVNYLLGYVGTDTELVLPENYNGESYEIYQYAFYENDNITSVVIGDSVTSIGELAFSRCRSLTSVDFGENSRLTSIGRYAFSNCDSLTSVVIGDSVMSIGYEAFSDCDSLTSIVIPDSVTSIGSDAFSNCDILAEVHISSIESWCGIKFSGYGANPLSYAHDLYLNGELVTKLIIPDSITSIGDYAFWGCYKLVEVVNQSSLNIVAGSSDYGYVSKYAIEVHSGAEASKIVNHNNYLFYTYKGVNYLFGYVGTDTELLLPEDYNGETYEIYQYAFAKEYNITSVVIPDSVTSIGEYAFSDCSSLTSIVIPDSVTSIGEYAFSDCSSLTSIVIPDSVISIGNYAFRDCNSLKIYCEATSWPSGWDYKWDFKSLYYNTATYVPVVWGYTPEE